MQSWRQQLYIVDEHTAALGLDVSTYLEYSRYSRWYEEHLVPALVECMHSTCWYRVPFGIAITITIAAPLVLHNS